MTPTDPFAVLFLPVRRGLDALIDEWQKGPLDTDADSVERFAGRCSGSVLLVYHAIARLRAHADVNRIGGGLDAFWGLESWVARVVDGTEDLSPGDPKRLAILEKIRAAFGGRVIEPPPEPDPTPEEIADLVARLKALPDEPDPLGPVVFPARGKLTKEAEPATLPFSTPSPAAPPKVSPPESIPVEYQSRPLTPSEAACHKFQRAYEKGRTDDYSNDRKRLNDLLASGEVRRGPAAQPSKHIYDIRDFPEPVQDAIRAIRPGKTG